MTPENNRPVLDHSRDQRIVFVTEAMVGGKRRKLC